MPKRRNYDVVRFGVYVATPLGSFSESIFACMPLPGFVFQLVAISYAGPEIAMRALGKPRESAPTVRPFDVEVDELMASSMRLK